MTDNDHYWFDDIDSTRITSLLNIKKTLCTFQGCSCVQQTLVQNLLHAGLLDLFYTLRKSLS